MRSLAIGDIHGCTTAFDLLLAAVKPEADDLIITLGDYVDRGPDSKGAVERLIALSKTHHLIALRGNHEEMMLKARGKPDEIRTWCLCGGDKTLASYKLPCKAGSSDELGDLNILSDVPAAHWEFLEQCVDWYEIETHFFVHANAYADLPLSEQPGYMLFWESLDASAPHCSGKVMVCGHTAQRSGGPLNLGHTICIDTWVYGEGWLTCLDVMSGQVWQASQRGAVRTAHIDEFATGP
jgi:serine/threonine protein phosphatase 1